MELVYSLRNLLQIGTTWLLPVVILYVLMLGTNWALGFAMPRLEITNLRPGLEAIRKSNGLPGLGAAIVNEDGVQFLATTGVRKKGDGTKVSDDDLWHLGSCGKAMTATMIARLVEAGSLRFEQTLGETFPEHTDKMSDRMKSITLTDLLSHRSGLPANFDLRAYQDETDVVAARERTLVEAAGKQLLSDPGKKFLYSNWGYTLAGHVAEKATGKSWETLMQTEVFEPLEMSSAGFGGTGSAGKIDQPWPHSSWGWAMPSNGKKMDNLPVMGPAGTIHMSLEDWGKFVAEHIKGAQGKSDYLSRATFQKLQTAVNDGYALGWGSFTRPGTGEQVLQHSGDNTMNHATVWAIPQEDCAVLVATNQGSAERAVEQVAVGVLRGWKEYLRRTPFSAVRWEELAPVVKVGDSWYRLLSVDGIGTAEIVAYSRRTYDQKWRMRFEQDLVEILVGMGHKPKETVRLVVRPTDSTVTQTLESVALTTENRQAVKAAATMP